MARTPRSSLTASSPLGLVLTILLSSGLSFAQPTTAPTTMSFPVMPRPRTVQLITEPAIPNLDVSNALTGIETRLASGARLSVNRAEVRISGDGVRQEARLALGVQIFDVPDPATVPTRELAEALAGEFRKMMKEYAALSPQERAERFRKNQAEDAELNRKLLALRALAKAQGEPSSVLADKVKQLKAQEQALRAERMGKEARMMALTEGLEKEKQQSQRRREDDPIVNELRKLLKLREDDVQRSKQLNAQGLISADEARKAEDALAETQIRVAEREAALAKSGKGELLDRLSDELAMVTIDMTDLKIRESMIHEQLQGYDAATLDEKRLSELMKQDPDIGVAEANRRPPLLDELHQKRCRLAREMFFMTVTAVEPDTSER